MATKLDYNCTFNFPERIYQPPNRLLLCAGPSNISPRVLKALAATPLGICDAETFKILDDIKELLCYLFQTKNEVTFLQQTSGTGGIETAITNLLEPREKLIVFIGGVWGERTADIGERHNVEVIRIRAKLGETFSLETIESEVAKHKPTMIFLTHGESSHGTLQNLEGVSEICKRYNCLFAVDCVVSIGGEPFFVDRWGIDVAVGATQKAISAPTGMSLLTFSEKAVAKITAKKSPIPFYYDVKELGNYWNFMGNKFRHYFYSYNSSLLLSVREALVEIIEEGLENVWKRHKDCAQRFWDSLERVGMKLLIENPEERLSTVTTVVLPEGVQWQKLLPFLMKEYNIDTSFGIGITKDVAIRVGIMGFNAKPAVVDFMIKAMEDGVRYCQQHKNQNGATNGLTDHF